VNRNQANTTSSKPAFSPGLPTSTTLGHAYQASSKYGIRIEPFEVDKGGLQVVPLLQWRPPPPTGRSAGLPGSLRRVSPPYVSACSPPTRILPEPFSPLLGGAGKERPVAAPPRTARAARFDRRPCRESTAGQAGLRWAALPLHVATCMQRSAALNLPLEQPHGHASCY